MSQPKPKPPTQYELVEHHLLMGWGITQAQAISDYGCYRLSHIIYLLRRDYPITSIQHTSINRFGAPVHFAEYKLTEFAQ